MLIYIVIVIISFLVFLFVIFILVTTFLTTMAAAGRFRCGVRGGTAVPRKHQCRILPADLRPCSHDPGSLFRPGGRPDG